MTTSVFISLIDTPAGEEVFSCCCTFQLARAFESSSKWAKRPLFFFVRAITATTSNNRTFLCGYQTFSCYSFRFCYYMVVQAKLAPTFRVQGNLKSAKQSNATTATSNNAGAIRLSSTLSETTSSLVDYHRPLQHNAGSSSFSCNGLTSSPRVFRAAPTSTMIRTRYLARLGFTHPLWIACNGHATTRTSTTRGTIVPQKQLQEHSLPLSCSHNKNNNNHSFSYQVALQEACREHNLPKIQKQPGHNRLSIPVNEESSCCPHLRGILSIKIPPSFNSSSSSSNKQHHGAKSVAFDPMVTVHPILSHRAYSSRIHNAYWPSGVEMQTSMTRNCLEFAAENWDWHNVVEESDMLYDARANRLIHPVHVLQFLAEQQQQQQLRQTEMESMENAAVGRIEPPSYMRNCEQNINRAVFSGSLLSHYNTPWISSLKLPLLLLHSVANHNI